MTGLRRGLGLTFGLASLLFFIVPGPGRAQESPQDGSRAVIALLERQNSALSSDLGRIRREIAALRAELDKPGVQDVFAGIGYIFGLCGVAAYCASRRAK